MQSAQNSQSQQLCLKCQTHQQVYISLICQHNFCLVCMSYILIKCRANKTNYHKNDDVTCPICNEITTLGQQPLQAIQTTIQQTLLPNLPKVNSIKEPIQQLSAQNTNQQQFQKKDSQQAIHMKKELRQSKNSIQGMKQKMKFSKRYSQQPSFDHITPSTKYFFSKCDSPISKQRIVDKEFCQSHPFQQLSFVCLTCQNQILCLKCVVMNKHKLHNIKNIQKGIDFLNQQISMRKIQVNQKIQYYQMWQRRLDDKKQIVKEKWDRTKQQISQNVRQVINKMRKKQSQLLEICDQHYKNLQDLVLKELDKLNKNLSSLKTSKSGFKALNITQKQKSHQFFSLFNKLKNNLSTNLSSNYQPQISLNFQSTVNLFQKDIVPLIDQISKISLTFNHKVNPTRLQTNFTSLNSSRQKKNKKNYSKTQQDELMQCRLSRKGQNLLVQSTQKFQKKKSKEILPAYVTKFFQKQNNKPCKGSINEIQKTMPGLENAKLNSSSKIGSINLSKSIMPIGEKKKKKMLKSNERLQRKTTNVLQSMKSQKNNVQIKKKKL